MALLYAYWEQHRYHQKRVSPKTAAIVAQAILTPWQREVFGQFHRGVSLLFDRQGLGKDLIRAAIGPRLPVSRMFRLARVYRQGTFRRQFAADPLALRSYDTESYLEYLTHQPPEPLAALQTPVLVPIGSRDRLVSVSYERRVCRALRDNGTDATLAVVPGASHAMFEEHTEPATDLIAGWLNDAFDGLHA